MPRAGATVPHIDSSSPEPTKLTACELAQAIRDRRWSATEILDAHLARISELNPSLNAVILLDEEGARKRAAEADAALARGETWGPLHGVPVTLKDSLSTRGLRTTSGFSPLAGHIPEQDATVVARIRAAGAVIVGKTNLPELAMNYQCDSPLLGRANNPYDPLRTPGGSTGGGAAAIATGMSALEIGSDIGGSVRIPAHYCGICALKPTEHRVPVTGHIPELPGAPRGVRHMATIGPLTRSVADLRLALGILAGPDRQYWETPPAPLDPVKVDRPRLAWAEGFGGCPVTMDTRRALAALASRLEQAGWVVEHRLPDGLDFEQVWDTYGRILWCEVGSTITPELEADSAREIMAGPAIDPIARGLEASIGATMRHFTTALTARDHLIATLDRFFDRFDAFLCPVTVGPAIRHCARGEAIPVDDVTVPYWMAGLAYTCPFNVLGNPAAVIPLARSVDGLPLGLQVVGRRWEDMRVLAIAEAIERMSP
jgi:amidase